MTRQCLITIAISVCLFIVGAFGTSHAGTNQWTGSGPFATGFGNRVINTLVLSPDGMTIYAGTGSGTVMEYSTAIKGDVNTDAKVNIVDALLIARIAAGLSVVSFNPAAADVNCDSKINIIDALLVARKAAGLAVPSWCP